MPMEIFTAMNKSDLRFYLIIGSILLVMISWWFSVNSNLFFRKDYVFIVVNAGGLDNGSEVWVNGPPHGNVLETKILNDREVAIRVEIEEDIEISTNAIATVRSMGMVGQRVLDIELKKGGTLLNEGDTLRGNYEEGPVHLVVFAQKFFEELLTGANLLKVSFNKTLLDSANQEKYGEIASRLSTLESKIKRMSSKYSKEIPETVDQGVKTLVRLGTESSKINNDLAEFKSDIVHLKSELVTMGENLAKTYEPVASSFEKIQNGEGTLGKITKDEDFKVKWNRFNVHLDSIAEVFNQGNTEINADLF